MHMGAEAQARPLLTRYGLGDVLAISDPDRRFYRALGLGAGTVRQIFGLKVWARGVRALLAGHGMGRMVGDGFQMPGAFLLSRGAVTRAFRHATAADRPDWDALVR